MSRIKKVKDQLAPPATRAEAEQYLNTVADLKIAELQFTSVLDQAINDLRAEHGPKIEQVQSVLKLHVEALEQWALANPTEFGKLKSIQMACGRIGFRTGTPAVKTVKGWKWDTVLARLKQVATQFVRQKEEVDKDAILATRHLDADALAALGMKIEQEETFYVEPEITRVPTRETQPA